MMVADPGDQPAIDLVGQAGQFAALAHGHFAEHGFGDHIEKGLGAAIGFVAGFAQPHRAAAAVLRVDCVFDPAAFVQRGDCAADIHRWQSGDFHQVVPGQVTFARQRHDHAQLVAADVGRFAHAVAHRAGNEAAQFQQAHQQFGGFGRGLGVGWLAHGGAAKPQDG